MGRGQTASGMTLLPAASGVWGLCTVNPLLFSFSDTLVLSMLPLLLLASEILSVAILSDLLSSNYLLNFAFVAPCLYSDSEYR